MTQDEIKEIIAKVYGVVWTNNAQLRDLTAFAKLVEEHERESCAEKAWIALVKHGQPLNVRQDITNAIRTRGQA